MYFNILVLIVINNLMLFCRGLMEVTLSYKKFVYVVVVDETIYV